MDFQFKKISVNSNNIHTYELTAYTKVDAPIEFETEKLIVQIRLEDKDNLEDLLFKEKQGYYLSPYHVFMTFCKTFKKLPYLLMKKFLSMCDTVVIVGNIKEPRYINRFEIAERGLKICKECIYDEVFLIDAVSEFVLSKSCRLVGFALAKAVPERADDLTSDEAKEISQSIKDFIGYWKSHGDYSQKTIANNLEKYCKTPRHDKHDERPFISMLGAYRRCKVQFFVFYVLIMSDLELIESTKNYRVLLRL